MAGGYQSLLFVCLFSGEIVKESHPGHHVQGGGRPHRHKGPHSRGSEYPEEQM